MAKLDCPTEIMLVVGPPFSGKSTFVAEHKRPGEMVFDVDRISEALTGAALQHGGWSLGVRAFVLAMRDAFIAKAQRSNAEYASRVWLIASTEDGLLTVRANTVRMSTPAHLCLERAAAGGPESRRMVEQWFQRNPF
jgi:predicted kinase